MLKAGDIGSKTVMKSAALIPNVRCILLNNWTPTSFLRIPNEISAPALGEREDDFRSKP